MAGIPAGKPRELAPKGVHNARCIYVCDIGTQPARVEGWDDQRKVKIGFQLVDEKMKNGKAFVVEAEYTFVDGSNGNLAKMLEAWLGVTELKKFDMDECLEQPAQVTIAHRESKSTGNPYAPITAITGVTKNNKVKKQTEKVWSLYLNDQFDAEVFNGLSDYFKNAIAKSEEYKVIHAGGKKTGGASKGTTRRKKEA